MGSNILKMSNNWEMLLQEVRYVLNLKRNLLSISMFNQFGLTIKIEQEVIKF